MVNTLVGVGGAAAVAVDLAQAFRNKGHRCCIVAGWQVRKIDHVVPMPMGHPRRRAIIDWLIGRFGHWPSFQRWCGDLERYKQHFEWPQPPHGDVDYAGPAGSWQILNMASRRPDIVHTHNLHGWYFDLRALPAISIRAPVVMTLHDAWMLAGHCAHSFGCARWLTGCGDCPDLSIPVPLKIDRSKENWQAKAAIYRRSRLRVVTPSQWLMRKVEQSMLWPAISEARVIPNGVDQRIFRPGKRLRDRRALGLPDDAMILLFAANGIRENVWKDYPTLEQAIVRLGADLGRKVLCLALGEEGPSQTFGQAELRLVPAVAGGEAIAAYYRAADLYVHAARADNFPNSVIEALACGTPVVATAVGGIPEQIWSLGGPGAEPSVPTYSIDRATGVLTPPGDAGAMAAAIAHLNDNPAMLAELARNAAHDARQRFDLDRQADLYLQWFHEIRERWTRERLTNRLTLARRAVMGFRA